MTDNCLHESIITYQPYPGVKARCCLDCGLTEIRFFGLNIRRYYSAPLMLGAMRKSLEAIERHLK